MITWHEYVGNIHIHTTHSDGTGTFADLAQAARKAELDFIIVTDHNVLVKEEEGYRDGVLILIGEEVHETGRKPEVNHLLCIGIRDDVAHLAGAPQKIIDAVNAQGGLTFLAHPIERSAPLVPETYPWVDWRVEGFTGIELWNYMSSFREFAVNRATALAFSYAPHLFPEGPLPEVLSLWDDLLRDSKVVAIGGSDAHGKVYSMGPLRRRIFPYDFLFRAVNTHILTPEPFTGQVERDAALVYEALRAGHAWVAYDLLGRTEHFRFWATAGDRRAIMGDDLPFREGITLHAVLPSPARMLLRQDGDVVHEVTGQTLTYQVKGAGVYRLEVWTKAWGKERGWIFANPIYIRE